LLATCARELPKLDGVAHICIAQHTWRGPRRVTLSRYCGDSHDVVARRLREHWHATGTLLTRVEGHGFCSDGGMAGNRPLFEDGRRPQLLVEPQKSGLPVSMVFAYCVAEAVRAVEQGQRDCAQLMEAWLGGGGRTACRSANGALSIVM